VVSNREKAIELYKAMSQDKMAAWMTANIKPAASAASN
jgi:hypothetical protein